MAVNLAVLTAMHRAKERSIEVDPNKLQAYLQFTAKVNLPKVINDVDYCDKQIDKINSKGQLYSLSPTEITIKDFPNLCGSAPLKKAITNPSKEDLINIIQLFIKRGWMNDPEYAAEKVAHLSFNELKRMLMGKGAIHKYFKDHKIDVSFTPPNQYDFEVALKRVAWEDSDDEEEVVDDDFDGDDEMEDPYEDPLEVEGVKGTSATLTPAESMGIDPDHVIQLVENKQRATIIPKLRRYLMDIAPNHLKARGTHLNTMPTERLLEMLHPHPLLTYLEETGMVKRQAITQPPEEEAQTEEKTPEEIAIDVDSYVAEEETPVYVSRNYLQSHCERGAGRE
jgi:hypothetical protein